MVNEISDTVEILPQQQNVMPTLPPVKIEKTCDNLFEFDNLGPDGSNDNDEKEEFTTFERQDKE